MFIHLKFDIRVHISILDILTILKNIFTLKFYLKFKSLASHVVCLNPFTLHFPIKSLTFICIDSWYPICRLRPGFAGPLVIVDRPLMLLAGPLSSSDGPLAIVGRPPRRWPAPRIFVQFAKSSQLTETTFERGLTSGLWRRPCRILLPGLAGPFVIIDRPLLSLAGPLSSLDGPLAIVGQPLVILVRILVTIAVGYFCFDCQQQTNDETFQFQIRKNYHMRTVRFCNKRKTWRI